MATLQVSREAPHPSFRVGSASPPGPALLPGAGLGQIPAQAVAGAGARSLPAKRSWGWGGARQQAGPQPQVSPFSCLCRTCQQLTQQGIVED